MVAHRPLRRSGRAALPHPALVSGADAVPRTDSAYPSPRLVHITPALCPVCAERAQVPLDQAPSLRLFRGRTAGVVQRLRRYYGPVRLPGAVHRRRASLDFPTRPAVLHGGRPRALPVLARGVSVHARGLRPRRTPQRLALATPGISPSACDHGVGVPKFVRFRGSIPGLHVPLSTLHADPRGPSCMTRGRCGSLHLHRTTLAFAAPRRFIPAHGHPDAVRPPPAVSPFDHRVRVGESSRGGDWQNMGFGEQPALPEEMPWHSR